MRRPPLLVIALAIAELALTTACTTDSPASPAVTSNSIVTWAASADQVGEAAPDQTYRLIVRTSVGGGGLRIRLSNALGRNPVTFGRAYVGARQAGAAMKAGSNRPLAFSGSSSVTVQPGDAVRSDPLPGKVPPRSDLVVSIYVQKASGTATGHRMAMQTSYIATGDHAADPYPSSFTRTTGSWFYLDAVDIGTHPGTGSVAVLGDSITDGWHSTSDQNNRWPDYLARRLAADRDTDIKGVANEGISGNKVLTDGSGQSALRRFDRDVQSQPGVRTVILFEGINDLKSGTGVSTADVVAGYRQIIARSHAAGQCIVGGTILPFKGWGEWTEAAEAIRQGVNSYVRTSGEFDAVLDFDATLRSPYDHTRLFPPFDSGDHVHPNDKGMLAIADTVNLPSLNCPRTW